MTEERGWPERAWWSVVLVDVATIFAAVVMGLTYGWGAGAGVAVVALCIGLWWQLGPYWTHAQRAAIRRRAQHRLDDRQE